MRISQGIPLGARTVLYDPYSFQDHEEVIIYQREEFRRTYRIMQGYLDDIFQVSHGVDRDDPNGLMGYWAWIMERINIINMELDSLIVEKPSQGYLDTYLYITVDVAEEEVLESLDWISGEYREVLGTGSDWL